MRVGLAQEQRRAHGPLGHQVETAPQARADLAVGTAGQVDGGRVPGPQAHRVVRPPSAGEQVPQTEHRVLEVRDADELPRAAGVGQPGIKPGLHVDVVVAAPGLLDHVEGGGPGAEMIAQDPRQARPVNSTRRSDHRPQPAARESADVGQLGTQLLVRRGPGRDHPGDDAVGGPPAISGHRRPPALVRGGLSREADTSRDDGVPVPEIRSGWSRRRRCARSVRTCRPPARAAVRRTAPRPPQAWCRDRPRRRGAPRRWSGGRPDR
jgi:hypothetical protein